MKHLRIFFLFIFFFLSFSGYACTGFFVQGSSHPIVAKNLDWMFEQGYIYINKRNVEKRAALIGKQNGVQWVSKYMSLTLTQDGIDFPWEGMNEAGLTVNVFQLPHSLVPFPSDPRPAIEVTQWIQYILDTSKNVNEAIQNAQTVRVSQTARENSDSYGPETTAHYLVCDVTSKCAVFEYIDRELKIYETGKNLPYPALTNNTYESSLNYLSSHLIDKENLDSSKTASFDRFVRATFWSENFQNYKKFGKTEVEYAFRGLQNVSQYYPYMTTHWSMVFELDSQTLNVKTSRAPALKSIHLKQFNPSCTEPAQVLNVNTIVAGNVSTTAFQNYSDAYNQALLNQNDLLSEALKLEMGQYHSIMTRCLEL